ncbi:hypothetical protein QYE76_040688 [Lolium multiflorum]|uniref:Retrovirus-related Pol polyprotein from transposon TNT 1-94-like beta-barrel domain-containing protein n=1 Tax=Lolium multiflorum TaxID=4521 RepID=A0AAD8TC43_LOLMU|nr:hypothetical protein QYE76_040688 [Lolium multiflorum]
MAHPPPHGSGDPQLAPSFGATDLHRLRPGPIPWRPSPALGCTALRRRCSNLRRAATNAAVPAASSALWATCYITNSGRPFVFGSPWRAIRRVHAFQQTTLINALQDMSMHGGWVADSGALTRMTNTNNQGILFNSRPTDSYAPVVFGNGFTVPISHIGHSSFQSPTCSMHLNDVLVVPNPVKDLISLRRFTTDNLLFMEFDPYGLSVKDYRTK